MNDPTIVNLKPLGSVVLVLPKVAKPAGETVQLADVTYEPETCGLVLSVGTGFHCQACGAEREPSVHVGDWVVFPRGAGGEVTLDGTDYVLLLEEECLAVLDPEPAVCEVT